MTVKDIPRAEFGYFSDYFFLETGVLKVRVVSPSLTVAIIFAFFLIIPVFAELPTVFVVLLSIPVLYLLARRRRGEVSRLTEDQLLTTGRGTRLIPWDEVRTVERGRWRRLYVHTKRETYTMGVPNKRHLRAIEEIVNARVPKVLTGVDMSVAPKEAGRFRRVLLVVTLGGALITGIGVVSILALPTSLASSPLVTALSYLGLFLLFNGLPAMLLQRSDLSSHFFRRLTYAATLIFDLGLLLTVLLLVSNGPATVIIGASFVLAIGILLLSIPLAKLGHLLLTGKGSG